MNQLLVRTRISLLNSNFKLLKKFIPILLNNNYNLNGNFSRLSHSEKIIHENVTQQESFMNRHIGPRDSDKITMLKQIGFNVNYI